jgi:hypothetical protein
VGVAKLCMRRHLAASTKPYNRPVQDERNRWRSKSSFGINAHVSKRGWYECECDRDQTLTQNVREHPSSSLACASDFSDRADMTATKPANPAKATAISATINNMSFSDIASLTSPPKESLVKKVSLDVAVTDEPRTAAWGRKQTFCPILPQRSLPWEKQTYQGEFGATNP